MTRKIFVLSACFSIRMGWKAVEVILSESTKKKITLTSGDSDKELKKMCPPWHLEKRFGGVAENTEVYWPPVIPSGAE